MTVNSVGEYRVSLELPVDMQCIRFSQADVLQVLLCRAADELMPQDGNFGLAAAATRAEGCQCCCIALTHNRDMKYLGCETVLDLDILCHGYG